MSKNDPAQTDPAVDDVSDADQQAAGQGEKPDAAERDGPDEGPGEIDRLRAELDEAKDRGLRVQAELENYRKRVARQMEEERRYAHMPLIRDLLPVWDNMGRAIEAAEKAHETASLLEGFKMVAGQLEDVLQRHHCTRIEALEEPFDPNLHEAIFQQPSDEHPANTVLQVTQTGFCLHDRVVRPSQVIVSAALPQTDGPAEPAEREERGEDEPKGGGPDDGTES